MWNLVTARFTADRVEPYNATHLVDGKVLHEFVVARLVGDTKQTIWFVAVETEDSERRIAGIDSSCLP